MDFINAIILLSNFVIVPSITYGSQLALGAIGVTLIYGVLRFANFAYGDLMAFGTMCVILFTWLLKSWGISLGILPTALLALPFGIVLTIGVSLFFDRTVFEYYRNKKSSPVMFIVVSLGIMFVLNAVVRIIIGPNDIVFDRNGNMWFTDLGKARNRDMDRGAVYWAKADGTEIREVIQPITTPNGIGLSPDETLG